MTSSRVTLPAAILVIAAGVVSAQQSPGSARGAGPSGPADSLARALVIGQAYASGNVYVGGFVEDEPRPWPKRIRLWPLRVATNAVMTADFFRTVTQDSEEHYWFPQRETAGDSSDADVFATIDRAAISDRNLSRYRASVSLLQGFSMVGWDDRITLVDNETFVVQGPLRPLTAGERAAVDSEKKSAPTDASQCSTVPQYLDSATVMWTARLAESQTRVRLSHYMTPGCAGHLSDIYVLDVIEPGQELRRYEFRHYQGLL